jgi:leader peptidase (prepilin peptidase)/N-methyltransferase
MLTGRKKRDSEMPFGPFLCLASLIAVLWGKELIHWYARVFWS